MLPQRADQQLYISENQISEITNELVFSEPVELTDAELGTVAAGNGDACAHVFDHASPRGVAHACSAEDGFAVLRAGLNFRFGTAFDRALIYATGGRAG